MQLAAPSLPAAYGCEYPCEQSGQSRAASSKEVWRGCQPSGRCKTGAILSPWQDLRELNVLGILPVLADAIDRLGRSQRGTVRQVGKHWAAAFPVEHLTAMNAPAKCISGRSGPEFWPCAMAGMCLHKLARFRDTLTSIELDLDDIRLDICLASMEYLPNLRSLSINLGNGSKGLDHAVFPANLECLKLYGTHDGLLSSASDLGKLTALEALSTPKYAPMSSGLCDITPLASLKSLQYLCIEYSPSWCSASHDALSSMTALRTLSLVGFSGRVLGCVKHLTRLSHLELSYDGDKSATIGWGDWETVAPPVPLKSTTLEITNSTPDVVRKLLSYVRPFRESFSSFSCHGCGFDSLGALALIENKNLSELYLTGIDAPEEIILVLQPLSRLRSLALGGIRLTDTGLSLLRAFTSLENLENLCHDGSRNGGYTVSGIDKLIASLPCLQTVSLEVTVDSWHSNVPQAENVARAFRKHMLQYPHLDSSVSLDIA